LAGDFLDDETEYAGACAVSPLVTRTVQQWNVKLCLVCVLEDPE
jgi:hypothetical protein